MSTLTASVDLLPVSASVPAARHLTVDLMRAWGSRRTGTTPRSW
jgi:hypothetical protein